MRKPNGSALDAKAAQAKQKELLSEQLDHEAKIASEKIRLRFDADRRALDRRYGIVRAFSSEVEKT